VRPASNISRFGYVPARVDRHEGNQRQMANGLAWSINGVAAYLMKQVGPKNFAEYVKKVGIPTKIDPYPSMALGACDLSLYEMIVGVIPCFPATVSAPGLIIFPG